MSWKRRPPAGNVRRVAAIGQNARGVMTNKAGRTVQFESFLERSLLLRLDRDRTVRDYGSQPETFHFRDDQGVSCTYTPDFIVWRWDGAVEIHEVTLTSRRPRPTSHRRETAAAAICQRRGWRYQVHTEQELPQAAELANLLVLFHYRPSAYDQPAIRQAALAYLANGQPVLFHSFNRQLATELGQLPTQVMATLCHLLWHGWLATDLHQPIFVQGELAIHMRVWLPSAEVAPWPTA